MKLKKLGAFLQAAIACYFVLALAIVVGFVTFDIVRTIVDKYFYF